jgi:hypothetical protein
LKKSGVGDQLLRLDELVLTNTESDKDTWQSKWNKESKVTDQSKSLCNSLIMLIVETQPIKLTINGIELKLIIENTIFKTFHVWGVQSRLQDLSVIIATKNDFLLLIELLKNITKI